MSKTVFLFPGQGAQTVGMASSAVTENPQCAKLFQTANDILGFDLLGLCLNGPAEKLDATAVSQPALFVAGLAGVERLRVSDPQAVDSCAGAAGLSLGEYTALVFAGVMSFEDGLRVVKVRGEAMQAAADVTPSAMVSVLGLDIPKVEELCAQASSHGHVRLANYLCPGNLVVSGTKSACDEVERLAPEMGAMKTIRLSVAGAFHTEIMKPADEKLAAVLEKVTLHSPRIPVYSNVTGLVHEGPEEIRKLLIKQVLEPVKWEAILRQMLADGFDKFYELGPGRVLAGLMKRVHRKADITNIEV